MPVSDTSIVDWKADFRADDTNSPSQSDWDTGVARDLDDEFRNIKSVVRAWSDPPSNKVWEVVENPETTQFFQHATLGFCIRVNGVDLVDRLEPWQVLKASRQLYADHVYFFAVTNAERETFGEITNTVIQVVPLPVPFKASWYAITGGDTLRAVSMGDPGSGGIFFSYGAGSPPVTGPQGLMVYATDGWTTNGMATQISDDTIDLALQIPALLNQGRITAVGQIAETWALNIYPYISGPYVGADPYIDNIYLGTKPSLFAKLRQSGQAVVTGTGIAGPYVMANLPRTEPDALYQLLLQVKGTTIPAPTVNQLTWRVSTKATDHFELTAAAVIPAGQTVTFDWMVNR